MAQKRLIDRDKIDAQRIAELTSIPREQVEVVLATAEIEMNNHKAPPGGICILDAAKKYGVSQQTISNWVKQGYISIIEKTAWRIYIDEQEVIKVVKLYKQSPGMGKWTLKKALAK